MLRPDYPIETARLTLRPFTRGDLDDLYAYQSREDVAQYLYWDARDRAGAAEALERKIAQTELSAECEVLTLAVVWREVGRVVGDVMLHWLSEYHQQGEIGYVFNPDYHGRGLATEATAEMLRLGFADLGLHRIIGRCDARNPASVRVMERLGMRQEAHFRHNEIFKGEWAEELVYAILAPEWKLRS
ncbi:MAG: GNAT family N-acetyltransferase [Mycobacteriales bacterium]